MVWSMRDLPRLEIGDEGYSGLSNLMLFDKNECSYLLTVNCKDYTHELGKYEPAVISDVIRYVEEGKMPKEEKRREIVNKYIWNSGPVFPVPPMGAKKSMKITNNLIKNMCIFEKRNENE